MGYLYFGIERAVLRMVLKRGTVLAATAGITLVAATATGSGHVAAWMGASTPDARNWIQAGVEKTAGSPPNEYIEIGRGGVQRSIRLWPTTLGHRAKIRLWRSGSLWRIAIDSHVSKWTWLPRTAREDTLKLLEIYDQGGASHGVAVIGTRRVSG